MKMKKLSILILLIMVGVGGALVMNAQQGEIIIPDNVKAEINKIASEDRMVVPTATEVIQEKQQIFQTWVSASIDLKKAQKRESKRFKRTSFTQELAKPVMRMPNERLKIEKKKGAMRPQLMLKPGLVKPGVIKPLKKPAKLLYREGLMHFEFYKLEDLTAAKPIAKNEALKIAKDFCLANKFIEETGKDKIGQTYVYDGRIAEEGAEGKKEKNYLVQQDVVFERWYEGKPVVNSKVVLGMKPSTKEIIEFKHLNWVPVKESAAHKVTAQTVKSSWSGNTNELQQRISTKIKKISGKFRRAHVKKTVSAWYQSGDQLVPILVFEVQLDFPGSKQLQEGRNYIEAINLAGSDDIFFQDQRQPQMPERK